MNKNFNKYIPVLFACIAAFVITLLIRVLLPTSDNVQYSGNELPLPNIPFINKDEKKEKDTFVLIAMKDIKQNEKILHQSVTWKKWPREAISSSFIAKDADGTMLNSNYAYSNVINLYAKYPISKGTPLSVSGLSRKKTVSSRKALTAAAEKELRETIEKELRNEIKTEYENKNKKAKEAEKRRQIEAAGDKVKSGMSVITVPIDQRSIASKGFLQIGDRVDLLYPLNNAAKTFKKFVNVIIVEIDGKKVFTSIDNIQNSIPKNVTVEVKSQYAEDLIREVSSGKQAVILVKNQRDVMREEVDANSAKMLLKKRQEEKKRNQLLYDMAVKQSDNPHGKNDNNNLLVEMAMKNLNSISSEKEEKKPDTTVKSGNPLARFIMSSFEEKDAKKGTKPEKKADNSIIKFAMNTFDQNDNDKKRDEKRGNPLLDIAVGNFNKISEQNTPLKHIDRIKKEILNRYANAQFNDNSYENNNQLRNILDESFQKQAINQGDAVGNIGADDSDDTVGGHITISRKNTSDSVMYNLRGKVIITDQEKSKQPEKSSKEEL